MAGGIFRPSIKNIKNTSLPSNTPVPRKPRKSSLFFRRLQCHPRMPRHVSTKPCGLPKESAVESKPQEASPLYLLALKDGGHSDAEANTP